MASDSILTSIPFWIVIGVIFVLAVAWAICFGTRVNPIKACGNCCSALGECGTTFWGYLTCCCRREAVEDTKPTKPTAVKKADDEELDTALRELTKLKDQLPLLPLKEDECRWDRKNYLVERAERTPTVV